MNGWRGKRGRWLWLAGAPLFIFLALWAADKLWPLPLNEVHPARVVVAHDGTPLWRFADAGGIWRYPVTIEEVSPRYLEALINYEDRWFWRHPGVNPFSVARAAWQDLTAGRVISGGSTLTMQVARLLDPHSRTFGGKIRQLWRALQLEWHLSKRDILTLYLNRAPFGGTLQGIGAASWAYFGKPPARLSYADAALLPTTDNALMDAMMYVIISENLHDRAFIARYAIGFDEDSMPEGVPANESLVAYLTGAKDGVVKSPEWAEKITHVPAQTIRQLARDYANTKPAALIQGWGPQRHNCGERTARGSTLLATITGNVGIKGGWAAGYGGCANRKFAAGPEMPDNPVKAKISVMNWVQAADDASKVTPDMGLKDADKLDSNIRILFSLAGNYLANQNPDLHQAVRVLEDESKIQFIVASDLFMTPSAKYADLLLPETSFMERWNIGETWGTASYLILSEKLIEPEFERRSDYDWLREVAAKLGIENEFSQGRDEKAWIEHIWEQTRLAMPDENLPDFATLQKTRQHLFKSAPFIAFEDNIRDPENHPFPTPSGKIEIFSKRLYDMQHPEIPALSHYVPAHEGPEDALAKDFPLQLITWKGKNRANSTQYANPWLIEVQQQTLWINPQDAQKRGITHGDMVRIHNSRGICEIPAEVTPRIIPGVVAMQAGAWWQPDENGVDKGGCANVLSSARITALAKGNSHQTMLVEVAKA